MSSLYTVCVTLVGIYRERGLCVAFWAEPLNALTNAAFLIAAILAFDFASRRRTTNPMTTVLLSIAVAIGIGSFLFHTIPNRLTYWLDIGPIALFQATFLWLASRKMLSLSARASAAVVIGVVGAAFALMPFRGPLNGSLQYMPPLLALLAIGFAWAKKSSDEPYLLVGAACCFVMALTARSLDWIVPWRIGDHSTGSHFIWHLLNGVVIYLALRAWIVFTSVESVASAHSNHQAANKTSAQFE